jgi:hypothetical protein
MVWGETIRDPFLLMQLQCRLELCRQDNPNALSTPSYAETENAMKRALANG